MTRRLVTLFNKEVLDLMRNRAALVPIVVAAAIALAMPFSITILVPAFARQPLGGDLELLRISRLADTGKALGANGRVQLFLFQQFLLVFLLMPITGAMSLAAHAIVGEKQARTLEPLLATPLTTFELLVAKVLGALVPTLAISAAALAIYFAGIALTADPGVVGAMLTFRTLLLVVDVAPLAALVSLQFAVVISSRVNDPRTAQQFGVLIILPLTVLLVAQFTGSLWLTNGMIALIGLGLFVVWILLTLLSVMMFERESILTRWK
jgi:ABC-2 type transport system permease protein